MATPVQLLLDKLMANAKAIFLVDSIGALVTGSLLMGIPALFSDGFGIPWKIIYALSAVAGIFALYSFWCFYFWPGNWQAYLKAIAVANLVYCCFTLGVVIYFYQRLTVLGWIYFPLELLVMIGLICIEMKIAAKPAGKKNQSF
jgi:hypothetical protein